MTDVDLPKEYVADYEAAVALTESDTLFRALNELSREPERFARAAESPADALREYGVAVPETLTVGLFQGSPGKPDPLEWQPFRFTLTRCRTFWVRVYDPDTEKTTYRLETICFGFVIERIPVDPRAMK